MYYLIIELLPILLFFIVYKLYNIYTATYVIIICSFIQIFLFRYIKGKFNTIQIITFLLFLFFGSMTVLLRNEIFIKIKPSILYIVLSLIFYISHFIGRKKPIIKNLLGDKIKLPNQIWFSLSYSWIIFFIILSVLNLYIAYNYETNTWMYFKVFGMLIISFIFILLQFIFIEKYLRNNK